VVSTDRLRIQMYGSSSVPGSQGSIFRTARAKVASLMRAGSDAILVVQVARMRMVFACSAHADERPSLGRVRSGVEDAARRRIGPRLAIRLQHCDRRRQFVEAVAPKPERLDVFDRNVKAGIVAGVHDQFCRADHWC